MNILHLCQLYYPSLGGCETFMKSFSERLAARGHRVTVFTSNSRGPRDFYFNDFRNDLPGEETINGVRVRRFNLYSLPFLPHAGSNMEKIPRGPYKHFLKKLLMEPLMPGEIFRLLASDFDLVTINPFPVINSQVVTFLQSAGKFPVVIIPCAHLEVKPYWEDKINRESLLKADAVIALTDHERDYFVRLGARPDRVFSTGVGLDTENHRTADPASLKKELGIGDARLITFLGRQIEQKGIGYLMRAFEPLLEEFPDAFLLIAGAHTEDSLILRDSIRAKLNRRAVQRMIFLDTFQEEKKNDILSATDIFVLPSRVESFGIAYCEAWLHGKPVIGADIPATRCLIENNVDGLLVPYGDTEGLRQAMLRLLLDPDLCRMMGRAGRQKVLRRYHADQVAAKWEGIYRDLVNGGEG